MVTNSSPIFALACLMLHFPQHNAAPITPPRLRLCHFWTTKNELLFSPCPAPSGCHLPWFRSIIYKFPSIRIFCLFALSCQGHGPISGQFWCQLHPIPWLMVPWWNALVSCNCWTDHHKFCQPHAVWFSAISSHPHILLIGFNGDWSPLLQRTVGLL